MWGYRRNSSQQRSSSAARPPWVSSSSLPRPACGEDSKLRQNLRNAADLGDPKQRVEETEIGGAADAGQKPATTFEVAFPEVKLGMRVLDLGPGLLPAVSLPPEGYAQIQAGDLILAVNEVPLRTHGRPYALALELIGASKRPVVLLFKRPGTSEERSRARRSAAENEDRSKGEFKEDPVGLRPGAKAATATGQWACPQCTFENAAALEGCGMCTFTPRRELLLAVGDEVTWKGSDDELPAGTVGVVVKVHSDGDIEAFFDRAPGHFSAADNVVHRVFTMAPQRLNLVRRAAAPRAAPQVSPARRHSADESALARQLEESQKSVAAATSQTSQPISGSKNGRALSAAVSAAAAAGGAEDAKIDGSVAAAAAEASRAAGSRFAQPTAKAKTPRTAAAGSATALAGSGGGGAPPGGDSERDASLAADARGGSADEVAWSEAGAAVVWRTHTFAFDLFEGHGLALTESLRVVGVAPGSPAHRARIPAGARVVAVDGARVSTLSKLRRGIAAKVAAASTPGQRGGSLAVAATAAAAARRAKSGATSASRGGQAWCRLEAKVPLELGASNEPPLIQEVTLWPAAAAGAAAHPSPGHAAADAGADAPEDPWAVGDAVCWRRGDDELPSDAVGRVLRVHGDGDVEALFPTARGSRRVFTFAGAALERVVAVELSSKDVVVVRSPRRDPAVDAALAAAAYARAADASCAAERERASARGTSSERKTTVASGDSDGRRDSDSDAGEVFEAVVVRTAGEQAWRDAFRAAASGTSSAAAELSGAQADRRSAGSSVGGSVVGSVGGGGVGEEKSGEPPPPPQLPLLRLPTPQVPPPLGRAAFVRVVSDLLAGTALGSPLSSGGGPLPSSSAPAAVPSPTDLERAFELAGADTSGGVNEEEFVHLMLLVTKGVVAGLGQKGFLGFGWGKEAKFKESLAIFAKTQTPTAATTAATNSVASLSAAGTAAATARAASFAPLSASSSVNICMADQRAAVESHEKASAGAATAGVPEAAPLTLAAAAPSTVGATDQAASRGGLEDGLAVEATRRPCVRRRSFHTENGFGAVMGWGEHEGESPAGVAGGGVDDGAAATEAAARVQGRQHSRRSWNSKAFDACAGGSGVSSRQAINETNGWTISEPLLVAAPPGPPPLVSSELPGSPPSPPLSDPLKELSPPGRRLFVRKSSQEDERATAASAAEQRGRSSSSSSSSSFSSLPRTLPSRAGAAHAFAFPGSSSTKRSGGGDRASSNSRVESVSAPPRRPSIGARPAKLDKRPAVVPAPPAPPPASPLSRRPPAPSRYAESQSFNRSLSSSSATSSATSSSQRKASEAAQGERGGERGPSRRPSWLLGGVRRSADVTDAPAGAATKSESQPLSKAAAVALATFGSKRAVSKA